MLQISYPPMRVFVGDVRMQPKVAPVLALMAVRAKQFPPDQAWVSAAEVALLPDWRNSKSKSVGTEVYNALRRLGLQRSGLVESPRLGKVTKWRFTDSVVVDWRPNFENVAAAVAADTAEISNGASTKLIDVATGYLSMRVDQNLIGDAVLQKLLESNPPWALMEKRDYSMALNRAKSLAKKATALLQQGDSCTAASLFSTAGCIANAEHAHEDARRWLMTAIPLLLAHGARTELEAALFNLSMNRAYTTEPKSALRIAANV